MSVLDKLTEGIVNRDLSKEGSALLGNWEKTGLLEGLSDERQKASMARLLENQAKELLREASTMQAGDVEGFASVAFPIVRRVFAGLIANDLVSVQPMSLPAGLIFFLDFVYSADGSSMPRLHAAADESLYGGGVVASQLTGGVSLDGRNLEKGFYSLSQGYASATGSFDPTYAVSRTTATGYTCVASGAFGGTVNVLPSAGEDGGVGTAYARGTVVNEAIHSILRHDPAFTSASAGQQGSAFAIFKVAGSSLEQFFSGSATSDNLVSINMSGADAFDKSSGNEEFGRFANVGDNTEVLHLRRLNQWSGSAANNGVWKAGDPKSDILLVLKGGLSETAANHAAGTSASFSDIASSTPESTALFFPVSDDMATEGAMGSIRGRADWALEAEATIPEIDIKVDSVAVTARTKKLKAKWSPELGQDLNAYHNLDAEVELTSILSEQIALEIDREILADLISGATAGTLYWSRSPGLFVDRTTGAEIGASSAAPDFTGTVSEWYETLVETINDVSAQIHRKTLRGGANFVVCGPEVANILEFTAGFRANVTADKDKGTIGAVNTGALSKKFDVYVDPYFPRNVILVGRRGGSFLESGYVYAPYVPLQTTPTIFGVEDFVPRKGVMTRYAKKMVRPDMYGLVIVRGLLGEAGATA